MDNRFFSLVEQLPAKLDRLLSVVPTKLPDVSMTTQRKGVYLFSESEIHLYVGRARDLKRRLRNHYRGTHSSASLAVRIARERTGIFATYKRETSAKYLIGNNPKFAAAFEAAKNRIQEMDVRWIAESDSLMQLLLEIYVAVSLNTKYNERRTT